jgi:hypothetical protein
MIIVDSSVWIWDVLDDIRPFNRATPHHDPAKIPKTLLDRLKN